LTELLNLWTTEENTSSRMKIVAFKEGNELYDAFILKKQTAVILDDVQAEEAFPLARKVGVKSLMALPVTVSDEFWGMLIFENFSKVPWTESDKQLGGFICSILSSSIRRIDAEKSLLKISAVVDSSPQYISLADLKGRLIYVNDAVKRITGYSEEELFKGGIRLLNKDGSAGEKSQKELYKTILHEGKHSFENIITTKDGRKITMFMTLFLIDRDKREIACIATDITELRRLEDELIKAKEAAENANAAKSEFLARMSHEIRTPINAIMGMTTIARGSTDVKKKDFCLEKIDTASAHLLGIINDILDMAKIEANKFELSESEFNVEKMIEDAVTVVSFRAEQEHQNIIINIESTLPKTIIADEMRLGQVIINLLTNAVKFTPEGGAVKVFIKKLAQEGQELTLKFEVQDNGIGISREQQAKLFHSFEQADGSISRKFGGTGLGLAISRKIVELMDGAISVESEPGKGATFTFTVKVSKGKQQNGIKLDPSVNLANVHVLAVDDSKEIREYFSNLMAKFSIKCDTATDAKEALTMIEAAKNSPYNIIFIDWLMPEIDGVELTKRIRQKHPKNCIVIMISTAKWNEIEKDAVEAGVDKFIGKPLFPSMLINTINEAVSGGIMLETKSPANNSAAGKKPNYEGKQILIAEDTDINREIIKAFLQITKVNIDFAVNGVEAVEMFKNNPDKYGLIMMDVHMPVMDGLEATRTIRALNIGKAKTIPIIALTANVFTEDIKECLDAGMNSHIGKPIDMNSMFETLLNYMPETGSEAKTPNAGSPYAEYMPYINVDEGISRLMNEKKFYFQLLKNFDGKKFSEGIVKSIKENDYKTVAVSAHTLKGVAANLSLTYLWELSKDLELQAKLTNDISGFAEKIEAATVKTLEAIEKLLNSQN